MRIVLQLIAGIWLLIFAPSCGSAKTQLAEEKVVVLANQEAVKQGFNLAEYETPEAKYEFAKHDKTWTVFYEGKEKARGLKAPGNHFLVWVNDQTGECKLMRGE